MSQQPGPTSHGATAADAHRSEGEQPRHAVQTGPTLNASRVGQMGIGEIIASLKTDGTRMLEDNVALAKAEIQPMAKHGGIGAGMFGGAGYLGACAAALLFMAGGFGFAQLWDSLVEGFGTLTSLALGFVTMSLVLLILAAVLALLGKKEVSKVHAPEQTIAEAKASIAALGESVKRGQQSVKVNALDRVGLKQDKKAVAEYEKAADKVRENNPHLT